MFPLLALTGARRCIPRHKKLWCGIGRGARGLPLLPPAPGMGIPPRASPGEGAGVSRQRSRCLQACRASLGCPPAPSAVPGGLVRPRAPGQPRRSPEVPPMAGGGCRGAGATARRWCRTSLQVRGHRPLARLLISSSPGSAPLLRVPQHPRRFPAKGRWERVSVCPQKCRSPPF